MSTPLMDSGLAQALAQGRSIIVPTPQHAARLALAWARARLAAGDAVWHSPDILTWEAWLAREWVRGRDARDDAPAPRLLNRAQERQLWAQVLDELDEGQGGGAPLATHAGALMRAAHRLGQSLLEPPRAGATAEERLLSETLRAVRARCAAGEFCSAGLLDPLQLSVITAPAPLIAGTARLAPLQQHLADTLWPDNSLLAACDDDRTATERALRAPGLHDEIQAAARWCREQLAVDGSRRLLVIDAARGRSIRAVAAEFWNAFAAGTEAELQAQRDPRLLAVQGGESLLQHALVSQALSALTLLRDPVELDALGQMLRSPYFGWPEEHATRIDAVLRELGRAQWDAQELRAVLERHAATEPRLGDLVKILDETAAVLDAGTARPAGLWAQAFDRALARLGFPGDRTPDTRDAQRLMRWRELLDEFASLEVSGARLAFADALRELEQLARLGAHEAASGDAAITLTADRSDPLVGYDGIWVLGLTGECWPEPPRPDPFVPIALQRHAGWPEASVALRQQQAAGELAGWRRRACELVLSHATHIDGVHQRPSRLLQGLEWEDVQPPAPADTPPVRLEAGPADELPPLPEDGGALRGALRSLQLQQNCPFRAQAEQRLGAAALARPADGIDARLRGQLLHAALEGLWRELRNQATLARLTVADRHESIRRNLRAAEAAVLRRWPAPPAERTLARERRRAEALLDTVLQAELEREPFEVDSIERRLSVESAGRRFELRIDRIDRLAGGARLVIDYKSGRAERILLEEGPLQPLQLALYATALAAAGEAPDALALQSLAAAETKFTGVYSDARPAVAGLRPLAAWEEQTRRWSTQLLQLLTDFLQGRADVAPLPGACRNCPLPAFCRVGDIAAAEDADV